MAAAAIVFFWLAFAATHMGLSSAPVRTRLIGAVGERGFLGVYSLFAFATFVPLVWFYFAHKHEGAFLWYFGSAPVLRWAMYAGMVIVLSLVVAALLRPSPAAIAPGKAEVAGAYYITRHPMFMAVGLYGVLHLLVARVNATELAFFAGFPLFAWAGCRHQDQRKLATGDAKFRRFHDETVFFPFTGRNSLRGLREIPIPLAIGTGLAIGLRVFHPRLFG
ncbi:MAG TPA: NnrU family protein [Myxococcota bacterium]|jgi:uncharacterized membrane protein